VMLKTGGSGQDARKWLAATGGNVRQALNIARKLPKKNI